MQITFNTYTMHLEDEPLEAGYASEKVQVASIGDEPKSLGGHNGQTQLIVSLPFIDETVEAELNRIAQTLHNSPLIEASASLIVADKADKSFDAIRGYELLIDKHNEFGDMYGVRLHNGPLEGELAKALFIISRDGALFYDEILSDVLGSFDADKALSKLAVAQECYTGKGCH